MAENHIVKAIIAALLVFSCAASVHAQTDEADQIDRVLRAREADLKKLNVQLDSLGRKNSGEGWVATENCVAKIPLLDQGIAMSKPQTEWSPGWQGGFADARQGLLLQRAYCALFGNDNEKAVELFDEMIADSTAYLKGRSGFIPQARACLAHIYATGKGVQADPVRAIGYYALSANGNSGDFCSYLGNPFFDDVPREIAEAVMSQDPKAQGDSGSLVYQFLRRGTARDYLTAVNLFDAVHEAPGKNSYAGSHKDYSEWRTIYRLALDGLPRSVAGFDEDAAAASELNYKLGAWGMEQTWLVRTQALTYSFLLDADSPAAREKLEQAYAKTPFTLILLDGREWSPSNAP
ncbi:MAG: hypothetical protein LBG66_02015 [Gallionellaceae bacterium]|nr:hypothetical protein [Gallionellaceae bacterium]